MDAWLNGSNLRVQEAALTGESEAVEKDADASCSRSDAVARRPPQHGLLRHARQLRPRRDARHDDGHADRARARSPA